MLKKIIIFVIFAATAVIAQTPGLSTITRAIGENNTTIHNFNGSNAIEFYVPANCSEDTLTWKIGYYNDIDSLDFTYNYSNEILYQFVVTPGRKYQFYPPLHFGLQWYGALYGTTAATAAETFKVRKGIYCKTN